MIQIFGTKKCADTKKAERFFKERRVKFQFINLAEKGFSKGELTSIRNALGADQLMNTQGQEYKKKGLEYMDFDPFEEILENPLLVKTPVVRLGNRASLGNAPEEWKKFLE